MEEDEQELESPAIEDAGEDGSEDKKRRTRLSPADWIKIVDDYELGHKGVTELSEEWGVTRQTISNYFRSNNVVRASRAHEVKEQEEKARAAAAKVAERYAEKRAEWVEETRLTAYAAMKQAQLLLSKRIIDAYKVPGGSAAAAMDDIKALRTYQSSLIENFSFRLNDLLRANEQMDEEDLPTLIVEDLTDEDLVDHYKNIGAINEEDDIDEILASMENVARAKK